MNRAALALSVIGLVTGAGAVETACDSTGSSRGPKGGASGTAAAGPADGPITEGGTLAFAPVLPCADSIASVYADPGDVSAQAKGAILKCAHDQDLTASALLTLAQATDTSTPPYSGKPFTSGAHVY